MSRPVSFLIDGRGIAEANYNSIFITGNVHSRSVGAVFFFFNLSVILYRFLLYVHSV